VCATVVPGEDLDILVTVTAIELVFDAEVREMDAVVEVRQRVFPCPLRDLARVTIRSAVAVPTIPIVGLEKLLILTLEIDLQHDALDLGAFLAEPVLGLHVRPEQLRVVLELAGATDPDVERLMIIVIPVTTMRLEHIPAAIGEHCRPLAAVDRHESDQVFVAQVIERVVARIQ
jgi:hypothetical protein